MIWLPVIAETLWHSTSLLVLCPIFPCFEGFLVGRNQVSEYISCIQKSMSLTGEAYTKENLFLKRNMKLNGIKSKKAPVA